MKIHFICRGNVLRSFIAETYLKSLNVDGVNCVSSGTCVDLESEAEKGYFHNTLALLGRHGILQYAKPLSDQLNQERIDGADITICMNQRVFDEASKIVSLPENTVVWDIVDIGEGARLVSDNTLDARIGYEEEIYGEITTRVDELVDRLKSS